MTQWVGGLLSLLTRATCCYQVLRRRWTIGGGRDRVFHRGRGGTGHRATAQPSHHAFLKDALIVDPSVHLQRTIYGYVKIMIDRTRDRLVGLDIDWTHAFEQFGRVFADPSHQLAYPSWVEIHVTCHVEHDSWKLKRIIILLIVTLFLKVFLQYFINWRFLIVWEKIGKFQNLGEDKKTNCYVQKKWKKFYFLFFSKEKREDHYYILKWKEIDWFRNFLSIKNE